MQTRAPLWLRLAALIAALYAAGHTAGMPWTPSHELPAQAVVAQMQGVHFSAAGSNRSYWDFYEGFGLAVSALLTVQAVLLWQLATIAKDEPHRVRPLVASFFLATIASGLIAWKLIFAVPVVFSGVLAACLALAYVAAGRRAS